MKRNLLRHRGADHEERVGFVELFFDLVFVFAVTQVSHALILHPDPKGFLQAGILFVAIWWVWVETAWVTNWLDVRHVPVRLLLFALMGVALVLSISLPEAFGERAWPFALAYVAIKSGRNLFMLLALARHNRDNFINFVRISCWSLLECGFWIGGALAESEAARMAIWGAAIFIVNVSPIVGFYLPGLGRSETRVWDVEGHHFSERCGLFIIIALGESILITGATFGETAWSAAAILAFASAFLGTLAMWWVYFDVGAERAARHLSHDEDPGRRARLYTYFHMPIVAGIIVTAASDEMAVAHPTGHHAGPAETALLLGGPALYLFGNMIFKRTTAPHFPLSHIAGLVLLGAAYLLSAGATPLALSLAATGVLWLVALWEMLSLRDTRRGLKNA